MKPGDRVRIKNDLILVDGSAIHAGDEFTVDRVFTTKTQQGTEQRIGLRNDTTSFVIMQVRLDQIERAEE